MGSRKPTFLVTIDQGAELDLRALARGRCLPKISTGISSIGYNPKRNRIGIDMDGLIGEWCACKIIGAEVDDRLCLGGDSGVDATLPDGRTVDVKYNSHTNGFLYFMKPKDFKADLAVLVVPSKHANTYRIVGWIDKKTFLEEMKEKDWGYGLRYGVPQHGLRCISELLEAVVNGASRKNTC